MNPLTQLRTDVVDALTEAGIKAEEYTAEVVTVPAAFVIPAEPYLSGPGDGTPFGHRDVHLQVLIVGGKGTNRAAAQYVDDALVTVLGVLDDGDWDVTEVSAPGQIQLNGNAYLGVVLSIDQTVRL